MLSKQLMFFMLFHFILISAQNNRIPLPNDDDNDITIGEHVGANYVFRGKSCYGSGQLGYFVHLSDALIKTLKIYVEKGSPVIKDGIPGSYFEHLYEVYAFENKCYRYKISYKAPIKDKPFQMTTDLNAAAFDSLYRSCREADPHSDATKGGKITLSAVSGGKPGYEIYMDPNEWNLSVYGLNKEFDRVCCNNYIGTTEAEDCG